MDNIIHIILDYVSRVLSAILNKISDISIIKEFPGISSILFTIILILVIRYIWKHGIDKFFDRHFSTKVKSQIIWLISIVGVVAFLLCVYAAIIQFHVGPTINDFIFDEPSYILALMLDPGQIDHLASSNIPHYRFAFFAALVGLLFVTGLTISTFTNIVQRRVNQYLNGETRYKYIRNHYVIIGFGELALTIMEQLFHKDPKSKILLMSSENTKEIRQTINTVIPKKQEKRVTIYRGRKDTIEDIESLNISKAKEVFLIGEKTELNRDASNVEALQLIISVIKRERNKIFHKIIKRIVGKLLPNAFDKRIQTMVLFEFQTTFAAFQITDIDDEWKKYIDFRPYNYYENWAKKLFYTRKYKNYNPEKATGKKQNNEEIFYPSLDREPITPDSDKYVHLVIFSMSRMGVALGTFAAQVCHFPNFVTKKKKTRITFITPEADTEMEFFRGRYARFFEVAPAFYRDFIGNTKTPNEIPPKYKELEDMLDVEFEFIRGKAEQKEIRNLLIQWAEDQKQLLSIAICQRDPSKNMAIGLYLPDIIYKNKIPVFIRQKSSGALLTQLGEKSKVSQYKRYENLYPFGMQDNCYDLDHDDITIAQLFNSFYYGIYKKGKFTKKELIQTIKESWNNLGIALQWSNLYTTYSVIFKLYSLYPSWDNDNIPLKCEKTDNSSSTEPNLGTELMAEVEHNRWNVEKLLLGYRVYTPEERKTDEGALKIWKEYMKTHNIDYDTIESIRDKKKKSRTITEQQHVDEFDMLRNLRKDNEKEDFAHNAIRPYKDLDEGNKRYDRFMTGNIPKLIILFNKLKDMDIKDNEEIYPLGTEDSFVLDDYIIRPQKTNQILITLLNKNHHNKNKSLWTRLLNSLSNKMRKEKKMCSSATAAPE